MDFPALKTRKAFGSKIAARFWSEQTMFNRIAAIVVMGLVGIFTLGFPLSMMMSGASGIVGALILTTLIAAVGRSSSVWSRLFLVNGLSALALPLVAIAFTASHASGIVHKASFASGGTYASDAGAMAGVALGGAALTGAAGFIGFFLGAIFLALAFFFRGSRA